jgi:hypothetical protein
MNVLPLLTSEHDRGLRLTVHRPSRSSQIELGARLLEDLCRLHCQRYLSALHKRALLHAITYHSGPGLHTTVIPLLTDEGNRGSGLTYLSHKDWSRSKFRRLSGVQGEAIR